MVATAKKIFMVEGLFESNGVLAAAKTKTKRKQRVSPAVVLGLFAGQGAAAAAAASPRIAGAAVSMHTRLEGQGECRGRANVDPNDASRRGASVVPLRRRR